MGDIKKNKRILITGGTSGLGRSLVNEFLAMGFEVVALGRQNVPVQNKLELISLFNVISQNLIL